MDLFNIIKRALNSCILYGDVNVEILIFLDTLLKNDDLSCL